jgi:hypothetical protein
VSLTEQGKEAVAAAVEMERSVLASASIDPDLLRQELQAVVRELASQFANSPGDGALAENLPSTR